MLYKDTGTLVLSCDSLGNVGPMGILCIYCYFKISYMMGYLRCQGWGWGGKRHLLPCLVT